MKARSASSIIICASILILTLEAKTLDPYKVLGVERNASQREIQKAFHKLSLQYHPDKNKNKAAQEKFAEINNAYDILSDEEKRKNYDLYGDEKGNTGFDAGHTGNQGGYTYFTSGGPGHDGYTFRPDEWQSTGGHGSSRSFSFSFGGPSGQGSSFGFGLDDIFSNFFGGGMGGGFQSGSFSGSTGSQSGFRSSPNSIHAVSSQAYEKEISNKGITWLLFSYTPTFKGTQHYESMVEEVAHSLRGAVKVGSINCKSELSLCEDLGVYPRKAPRVFVYSYIASDGGSLVEYSGDSSAKNLKMFCQEHLPRFSKRIDLGHLDFSGTRETLPKVMLLSTKKDTPVIWRVLSGLYRNRIAFYDAEVHDVSDPNVRSLGVDVLPAIVGWLSNGENHILKTGISVKDIQSAVQDLSALLNGFEKKNKKAAIQAKKAHRESGDKQQISLLTGSNFDALCGDTTPVCIIGAFKSFRAKGKLEAVLLPVSQKSLLRRRNLGSSSGDSISYSLLDASKYPAFFNAFDKSGFKSLDKLLIAYKPRKGKFAAFTGEVALEEVERFISSVLNGDVQFNKTRQKPTLK